MLTQTTKIIGYNEITIEGIHLGQKWITNRRTHSEFASLLEALPPSTTGLQIRGCRNPFLLFNKIKNGELPNLAYLDVSENGEDFGFNLARELPSIAVLVPKLTKLKLGNNTSHMSGDTKVAGMLMDAIYEFFKERNECEEIVPITFLDFSFSGIPANHPKVTKTCALLANDPYIQWFGDSWWDPQRHPLKKTLVTNQQTAQCNLQIDRILVETLDFLPVHLVILMLIRSYCWVGAARIDSEAQTLLFQSAFISSSSQPNETLAAAALVYPRVSYPPTHPMVNQPENKKKTAEDFLNSQILELQRIAQQRKDPPPSSPLPCANTENDYALALALSKSDEAAAAHSFKQCDWCHKTIRGSLWRCKKCKRVYYCNETCQRYDWNSHRPACLGATVVDQPYHRNLFERFDAFEANHKDQPDGERNLDWFQRKDAKKDPPSQALSRKPIASLKPITDTNKQCEFCRKFGCLQRCKQCKLVYYCNETCQRQDWRSHRTLCQDGKWIDQPYHQNLFERLLKDDDDGRCRTCQQLLGGVDSICCEKCQKVHYCCKECQFANWESHKWTCKESWFDKTFNKNDKDKDDKDKDNKKDKTAAEHNQATHSLFEKQEQQQPFCQVCGKKENVQKCKKCCLIYCSSKCHREFYKYHKFSPIL